MPSCPSLSTVSLKIFISQKLFDNFFFGMELYNEGTNVLLKCGFGLIILKVNC